MSLVTSCIDLSLGYLPQVSYQITLTPGKFKTNRWLAKNEKQSAPPSKTDLKCYLVKGVCWSLWNQDHRCLTKRNLCYNVNNVQENICLVHSLSLSWHLKFPCILLIEKILSFFARNLVYIAKINLQDIIYITSGSLSFVCKYVYVTV